MSPKFLKVTDGILKKGIDVDSLEDLKAKAKTALGYQAAEDILIMEKVTKIVIEEPIEHVFGDRELIDKLFPRRLFRAQVQRRIDQELGGRGRNEPALGLMQRDGGEVVLGALVHGRRVGRARG